MAGADPVTQAWLAAHKEPVFGFPGLVRFSWQGTVRILAEHGASVQWYDPCHTQALQAEGPTQCKCTRSSRLQFLYSFANIPFKLDS